MPDASESDPSPEKVREECWKIQGGWTEVDRRSWQSITKQDKKYFIPQDVEVLIER